ncbi:MAG: SOS response-associated peptidase, partial [Anaerovoracaceae bacterium]
APIVVFGGVGGGLRWKNMKWGFSYDGGAGGRSGLVINARSETIFQKKMFRESALERRCVIPARSFYEWDRDRKKVEFSNADGSVIFLAGLYRDIESGGDFVVITRDADSSVSPVHDRMPLVITRDMIDEWVSDTEKTDECIAAACGGFSGSRGDETGQIDMFSELL